MLKRGLIVLSLTLAFIVGLEPLQEAQSKLLTAVELSLLNSAPPQQATGNDSKPDRGNRVVRVLKAPFKALGRLFGHGEKDENKLHSLSEKDVKNFETAPMTRVIDARTVIAPATTNGEPEPGSTSPAPEASGAIDSSQALALELLDKGKVLLANGYQSEAIASLSQATSLNPKLYEAHNLLGIAYESKGMRNLALRSFEAALKGKHDDPEHLNNMGYLLMRNGDFEDAIKHLKKAVKLAPNEQRYWNNLGLAQARYGKFDDAYKSFERAVGEFEGHMNIAGRLQRQGYDKDAIKHLERARAIQPTNLDILHRLGVLYARTGKPERAEEARQSIVALQSLARARRVNP